MVQLQRFAVYLILPAATWMSGCANYYLPNSHNVPLLTKKGDARFSISVTDVKPTKSDNRPYQADLQGSYAVSDKIGVVLNTSVATNPLALTNEGYKYLDLGAGYFKTYKAERLIFETYGGIGFGNSSRTFFGGFYNNTNFIKYYVQPSLGYKRKIFELAISWRLAVLNFTAMNSSGTLDSQNQAIIQAIQNNPTSILSEPALTARFGFKAFKLQAQYGWSHNLSGSDYPQGRSYLSLGVFFSMGRNAE